MKDYIGLPHDLSPEIGQAVAKVKTLVKEHISQVIQKPPSWAVVDLETKVQEEIKKIAALCPPGTIGTFSLGMPTVRVHKYKEFVIAIKVVRKQSGQYSTLSGTRKCGTPSSQEEFSLVDEDFPTEEAAVEAALESRRNPIGRWARGL